MTIDTAPVRADARDGAPEAPATSGRRRTRLALRPGAGRQHHAGPLAYLLLGLAALVSLFPLYWT
ncbi:carbohydrate ABC transporter permease, partial [Streptomyces niveus]